MEERRSAYEQLGNLIMSVVGVISLIAALTTLFLYFSREYVWAAIVGTGAVALFILLIVVVTSVVSSHRTVRMMKEGAEIALRAQGENDRWDTQKAKVFADIFSQGAKISAAHRPLLAQPPGGHPSGTPPLPLPSQDSSSWLPPLTATTIEADEVLFEVEPNSDE